MFRVIRALSMSAVEFTEEWFESEAAQGGGRAPSRIHGVTLGLDVGGHRLHADAQLAQPRRPRPPAAARRQRPHRRCAGRCAEGARRRDAHRRPACKIVLVDKQRVAGVRLADGEEIPRATGRVSAADPRHTLLGLVGAPELPPEFVWHTQSIKMRGSVAKVHLLTDGNHGLPDGTLVVAPTLKYLERAYDAAKYGEMSRAALSRSHDRGPTSSRSTSSSRRTRLRERRLGGRRASTLERCAVDTLAAHFPALKASIRELASITPLDLEQRLRPDRRRPQPRPADPRPDVLHAPDAGLVEPPHADRRPVPVRQRRAWRRRHQRRGGRNAARAILSARE